MEIKYTLEILTKDIQDIGKLVENLQNSPEGSTLELDLALSKLRNVYDILTVIRTDITTPGLLYSQTPVVDAPQSKPIVEAVPVVEAVPFVEPGPVVEPEPVVETPLPTPEPQTVMEPIREKANPGIIADKYTAESSINENLAGNHEQEKESKLMGPRIDNIGRNIGINDRFLIIRELFDGDSDGFGKLIKDLDNAGSKKAAVERLSMQFVKTPNHEGVAILSTLVKRKYSEI